MTRKELIAKCVEYLIKNGVVKPENKSLQIKTRLFGGFGLKPMSKSECERWYNSLFN